MKTTLFSALLALVFTTGLFAQHTVTNQKHERLLTHVENNIFDVQFLDDNRIVVQEGQYWNVGNRYIPHGIWRLYAHNSNEVVTKVTFDRGKQLSVETIIDGKLVKTDKKELTAKK